MARPLVWLRVLGPLLVASLALFAVRPARAADIESELVKQGVAAYNDLEYAHAVELLQKALDTETLTRDERIVTYQTLAFAHVGLDKPDDAVTDFENLLRVDDGFELDRTISPRVRAVFEKARARVATGHAVESPAAPTLPTVTPTVTPAKIKDGQAVVVSGAYPGGMANRVELFYRTRGTAVFAKLTAPTSGDGAFRVTVPGMQVHGPALEYYLVVLDDAGASVAAAGTLGQPLAVAVQGRKKPVYTKGWFWGVVAGVAVVGAGVATAVALSSRSSISPSTPATVTIQPQ